MITRYVKSRSRRPPFSDGFPSYFHTFSWSLRRSFTMAEAVDLFNPLTSLDLSDTENLDIADAQANIISTSGQLLTVFGPIFGGAFFGAISAIIGIAALVGSNDLRRRIELERYLRGTTTPVPVTNPTTVSSKSQNSQDWRSEEWRPRGVVKTYTVHNLYTQPPQLIPNNMPSQLIGTKTDVKVPKLIPFLRLTTT